VRVYIVTRVKAFQDETFKPSEDPQITFFRMEPGRSLVRDVGMDVEAPCLSEHATDDRALFDEFYADNRDQLYRGVAIVVGDATRACEAVDEALARAWERWDSIGAYDCPEAWVYRVAINVAVSSHRKRRREVIAPDPVVGVVSDALPEVELSAAIDRLPLKQRAVIVARFLLDWSVEQTSEALDLAPGTVKSRTSRALARLSREIKGR